MADELRRFFKTEPLVYLSAVKITQVNSQFHLCNGDRRIGKDQVDRLYGSAGGEQFQRPLSVYSARGTCDRDSKIHRNTQILTSASELTVISLSAIVTTQD